MASDHVYYTRGGAHTVPASHFVVEAIHARRGLTRPLLRWTLRHKPSNYSVIQLGIVALSSAPALDVQIQFDRLPRLFRRGSEDRFPLRIPVVNAENPFFFDFDAPTFGQDETGPLEMQLRYTDIAGHEYDFSASVDIEKQIGPVLIGTTEGQKIERQLDEIERTLRNIAGAIGKNESHLRDLVRKVR